MFEGPIVTAVLVCEKIIEGKDGVLSVIGIMDAMTVTLLSGAPDNFPSEEDRLPVGFDLLVSVKTNSSPGEHAIRVDLISPSGKRSESPIYRMALPQPEHGAANLILHQTVQLKQGGLFFFEVFVDDKLASRLPFRIDIIRPISPIHADSVQELATQELSAISG